ncbi:hypothetical protein ML462_12025 [Gramella lutea]|uniref:Uncharacterized protein n=1 Tax=Christiangramia lutea TaxID=1607951 RepID=A0A9X2AA08_9FLAO|nr:hypothetical protein [Christiangramia lutea]MCH4823900.1 hypothetical protein [Christiangramia lutea]
MKNFTLPAILLFSGFLNAQSGTNGAPPPPPTNNPSEITQVTLDFLNEMDNLSRHPNMSKEKFSGSPFLDDEFRMGKILSRGKEMPVLLRYNVLSNQIEIKVDENDEVITLPRDQSTRYMLEGYEYVWMNLLTEEGWKKGYYVKYFEGDKVKFMGLPSISVRKAEKQSSGYSKAKTAHYKVDMNYYLAKGDSRLESVKIKNRDFEKYLNLDDRGEDFLDENKIKEVADAIDFLEYYETY